ncbi:BlaI/MecI/CopY family transcriptional regulator [candidate division KSB1 bacterium]|nr:BlaI/MecI/CopY family transcriptional regulator [candidate division KSB1 bacterium]
MSKINNQNLSEIEWGIMRVLWDKGVLSVKDVWNKLYPNGEKAYTTIQTYMDRMIEKGLLRKEKIGLVNFYQPVVQQEKMMSQATDRFVSNAFGGSFGHLAAFLVGSGKLSSEDINKIKKLINEAEGE